MKRFSLAGARAVLLAGPTALAFFTGGYFAAAREWAGFGAWLLVVVALLAGSRFPRTRESQLALIGLALFGAWTLGSIAWAPIHGNAYAAGQIVILYLGGLLAAALLLRNRRMLALLEPAVAAGTLIVIGYGLSERFLPGLLHFTRSISAQGRLEQPLTYWNAMGEVAAIGFVLCARIAGDAVRSPRLRTAAAAATAPLGLGLYLSVSRGALFACAAGLIALLFSAPKREQLDAILVAIAAGAVASVCAAPFGGVTSLKGSLGTREGQGAVVLIALVVIVLVTTAGTWRLVARGRSGELRLPRHGPWLAVGLICLGLAIAILVGAKEGGGTALSSNASRLVSVQSNRYDYWKVALRAFGQEPVHGVGAGNWSVWWLRYRTIGEDATDAHSLELQTLAELGIVGFALLLAFLAGVGLAGRNALRALPTRAVGPLAGVVVYIAHSPLDWDWQIPAVTLIGIVLGGGLLALAELAAPLRAAAARR